MTENTLPAPKIRAVDLLNDYHIDPLKIAEWIIDERIQIVGILEAAQNLNPYELQEISKLQIVGILKTPKKPNPYEEPKLQKVPKLQLDDSKFQGVVQMRTQQLRILLKSKVELDDRINKRSGVSFDLVDQGPEIDEKIQTVVGRFVFARDSFLKLYLNNDLSPIEDEGMPPDVDNDIPPAGECSDRPLPKQYDSQGEKAQSETIPIIEVIKEADRCYVVYKDLCKNKNESVTHDIWAEKIETLDLNHILSQDIIGIHLHYAPSDKKRNITNNLIVRALLRLGKKYSVNEIQEFRKSLFL